MSRRKLSLATVAGLLALPAAAHAATTYTVDPSAAAGCSAANVCKTITDANAKVTDGDTVSILKGNYTEPAIAVKKNGVTFSAAAPGQVVITSTATGTTGAFTLGDGTGAGKGTVLSGLTIAAPAGPAVVVEAQDTMVTGCGLARIGATTDVAVYQVTDSGNGFAGGVATLAGSSVFQLPTLANAGTAPAIQGGTRTSLEIDDTVAVSGAKSGPAVALSGSDQPTSGAPRANLITRGSMIATNPASDAVTLTSASGDATPKALTVDSAMLIPGKSATGLNATSTAATVPPATAGAITATLHHATIAGGAAPFTVKALAQGAGNVTVTADDSILHGTGASTVTNTPATTVLGTTLVAKNTAQLTETSSDTTDKTTTTADATTTVNGGQSTPDATIFANPGGGDYHILPGTPVIDRGGAQVAGQSTKDFEGEPRVNGPASDLGADEYTNQPPTAALTTDRTTVGPGQAVNFDLSGSRDPGPGGAIVNYVYDFGDGTPAQMGTNPKATHAYAAPGTYTVVGGVADGSGAFAVAQTTIAVVDTSGPTVTITSPKAGSSQKLFSTKTKRQTLKPARAGGKRRVRTTTTRTLRKITFTGTATATGGVQSVELSLRRVSTSGKLLPAKKTKTKTLRAATPKSCTFFDAKSQTFVGAPCDKPLFFTVALKPDGTFAYTLKGKRFRGGSYELAARGTTKAGVVSAPVTTAFRLTQ